MKSKNSPQPRVTSAASGTQECSPDSLLAQAGTSASLEALVHRYQRRKRPITVNFRSLLPDLNSPDRFTHIIHPYPAKLLVHIPYFFLANDLLSAPGDLVLDPFCGSGTVLLEAQLAGRRACGADANPLARLIARVKTTPLDTAAAKATLSAVLDGIPAHPTGPPPDVVNLEHWYYPSTARQLQCLHEAILRVRNLAIRDFLSVCFSVCARKVSLADPRLSVPVRLRVDQYPKDHPLHATTAARLRSLPHVRVPQVFASIAQSNILRFEKLNANSPRNPDVEVLCSDARHLVNEYSHNGSFGKPLHDESVQLIVTSPPYPGAQKYIRSCSLSLGWLGLCPTSELRAYKGRTIGREEFTRLESKEVPTTNVSAADRLIAAIRRQSPIRATIAATYLIEMRSALQEMYRVLKPNGHIVMVVANNRIGGRDFRTVDYLRTIAEGCGLSLTACFIDAIRSRGLMTKRNHTASVITREWVLILAKGDAPQWSH
jgi:DNA modification methylase